jgi:membrane associated rhomboid family serine protease
MLSFTQLFPIGDDNRNVRHFPFVTYLLIAANIAVFFLLQLHHSQFTYGFSVIPREILSGVDLVHQVGRIPQAPGPHPIYLTLFTAMFMHGSILHLGGNMLYLWIFGDNVEEALGHGRFLLFYIACGLVAAFAQIAAAPHSVIPSLGASGAIAGILGGYILMFPRQRVRVLVGFFGVIELSAFIVIGLWIFLQLMNGVGQLSAITRSDTGGVAYLAHVGGAFAGLLLTPFLRKRVK